MFALAGIGMFVEVCAVKFGQPVGVFGEMTGNPVENHTDAALVAFVDEMAEFVRVAEAAGRGVIAGDLIPPRAVERVLCHGHQFDVGVAHFADVVQEPVREFQIGKRAIALLRHARPGAEVHLVNAHGAALPFLALTGFHPGFIRPAIPVQVKNDASSFLTVLCIKSEGVALEKDVSVAALELEFVMGSLADARDEDFPHACAGVFAHRVDPSVPAVPVAHNAHALGVGSPDCEKAACRAVKLRQVRAKFFVELPVVSLGEEMQVERPEELPVGVGIALRPFLVVVAGKPELVGKALAGVADQGFKKTGVMKADRRVTPGRVFQGLHHHFAGIRPQNAHHEMVSRRVHSKHRKRIAMVCAQKGAEVAVIKGSVVHRKAERGSRIEKTGGQKSLQQTFTPGAWQNRLTNSRCACNTGIFSRKLQP